jgi:hypothetical protein
MFFDRVAKLESVFMDHRVSEDLVFIHLALLSVVVLV